MGMGGNTPLTWMEVAAFAQATGAVSEPWEAQMLFDMSAAYADGRTAGNEPLAMPPFEMGR